MEHNTLIYIAVMALVTYLIRVIPLTLIKKEITSPFIKSFLFYVPYVTLSVMIFPAILGATGSIWSGIIGFIVATVAAFFGRSMVQVSLLACLSVLVAEFFI